MSLIRKQEWSVNIKQDVHLISNKQRYHLVPIWLPIIKKSDIATYRPEYGPMQTQILLVEV